MLWRWLQLESLDYQQKKNPFSASAAPMKLYNKAEVCLLDRHGVGQQPGKGGGSD